MQFFETKPMSYGPRHRGKIVVWGLMGRSPFGGMVWQVVHYLVPLRRMGFDVWYVEDSDAYVSDPVTFEPSSSCETNIARLRAVMEAIGLGDRWVFRLPTTQAFRGALDGAGLQRLYAECDAAFNLCGAQEMTELHARIPTRVYLETDPVLMQVAVAAGNQELVEQLELYDHLFTYGENLGAEDCLAPETQFLWKKTRPPVCMEFWSNDQLPRRDARFTSIANWKHSGKDIEWDGHTWRWSKHHNFLEFIELPQAVDAGVELAVGAIDSEERELLEKNGWVTSSSSRLDSPEAYRQFIQQSRGEFSVAKEQYVAPRSGWFSDRSVCYLAAGRPVIMQSTAFEKFVPTGEGLFAFETRRQAAEAIEAVLADYPRHSRAAQQVAREYFDADKVVRQLVSEIGLM
jgi:hypothetical protein